MKISFCISMIPLVATFFAATALAYPVSGYQGTEIVVRSKLPDSDVGNYLVRRAGRLSGVFKIVKKLFKKPTEEEKRRRLERAQANKRYQKQGKEHARKAAKDGRTSENMHVKYTGPEAHEQAATDAAREGWRDNENLQRFTHADVNAQVLKSGRKHVAVKYHNEINDINITPVAHTSYVVE